MTESATASQFTAIGRRTRLIEGETKVTGRIRFISDLKLPGMLEARFVTSPHAHARITKIDTTAAAALPGVVAVLTAADLPQYCANEPPTLVIGPRPRDSLPANRWHWCWPRTTRLQKMLSNWSRSPMNRCVRRSRLMMCWQPMRPWFWPGGKPGEAGGCSSTRGSGR